jgi:eukaryotic-like serine/threonine-protein kinase
VSGERATEPDEAALGSGQRARATRAGEVIGDTYRLNELIGSGGMAEVYSAEHLRIGRRFAVKVLRAGTSSQTLQRFRREARAIARIDNEFVVGVVDCGETADGTPFLVMELLNGEDLRALLDREGALPIRRAVNLVWEACQGIAAVHACSLVHRDLKPENLFVSKRATGQDWCRVLDFGIAKTEVSSSTAEGAVLGTVRYMAPEQLQDSASAGPGVDVYALGAVLYECLTGSSPHRGGTVQELMFKILNEPVARLELARTKVPKPLADAVHRALSKSARERFADVRQFAAAIAPYTRRVASDDLDARAATVELENEAKAQPPRRRASRSYAAIALSGLIGLGVGVALRSRPVVVPVSAHSAPAPSQQTAPPVIASASAASAPVNPPIPSTSPTFSTSATGAPKARPPAVGRPSPVLPRVRFDSENPYGH